MHWNDGHSSADLDALERAEHYRALAQELRAVAALVQNPGTKLQLRATAKSYDRIAQSVLAMNRIDLSVPQPAPRGDHA